jgi:1-phosphofructokinase
MIVTLTANPSIDRTVELDAPLQVGEVQRARAVVDQPGGKGVNVTRAVESAGKLCVAVFPGRDDDPFVTLLRAAQMTYRPVAFPGRVRTNIAVVDPTGVTTKINEAGDALDGQVLEALITAVRRECQAARWAVLAGSLPAGVRPDWYAEVVAALRETAAKVAIDTSGAPLLASAAADPKPHLLKPNGPELAELAGTDDDLEADVDAAASAARHLVEQGTETLLVTLGGAGALLVNADGAWFGKNGEPVEVRSTVGAGDSTLSGYLLADLDGLDPADRLRRAIAYGTAAVQLPGTTIPTPADVNEEAVVVNAL